MSSLTPLHLIEEQRGVTNNPPPCLSTWRLAVCVLFFIFPFPNFDHKLIYSLLSFPLKLFSIFRHLEKTDSKKDSRYQQDQSSNRVKDILLPKEKYRFRKSKMFWSYTRVLGQYIIAQVTRVNYQDKKSNKYDF